MNDNIILGCADYIEIDEKKISKLSSEKQFDAIILQTNFLSSDVHKKHVLNSTNQFFQNTYSLINKISSHLKDGGLLFIYGLPAYLPIIGDFLNNKKDTDIHYIFKYWIACEFASFPSPHILPNSHMGMLMYLKSNSRKNPTPFFLNTKFVRLPYSTCPSCNKQTKDWGGKKHLLNPLGSAISDVWSFPEIPFNTTCKIPSAIIERILLLLSEGKEVLKVNQSNTSYEFSSNKEEFSMSSVRSDDLPFLDSVVHESCIDFLNKTAIEYPNGIFDLAFADPPYNLAKDYGKYDDDLDDKKYIEWCNEWLDGMYKNLKPGGALLILNIPKWSIDHFKFLSEKMIFQNWIVWDALSTPSGKLLPAHYSLLYFTKPGGKTTINIPNTLQIQRRDYCLRASCIKSRSKEDEENKEIITDIWKDIHRIKHKKDRDQHPCQLPIKLMERIISIFSNEGDLIFDPFGGAGSTAIAAKLHNRNFVITEIDDLYVDISRSNISAISFDSSGNKIYQRKSKKNENKSLVSKKEFEDSFLKFCVANNGVLSEEELLQKHPDLYALLPHYKGDFKKLYAFAKRKLETNNLFSSI